MLTVQETIKHLGGVDPFFQAIADTYGIPVMVAIGKARTQTFKGEQKPYLVTSRFKVYGANYSTKENTNFAPMAIEEKSEEIYQFLLINKLITRKFIAQDSSQEMQEISLDKALQRTGVSMSKDKEAKTLRLVPMKFPHMKMSVFVRRRAY